MKTLRESETQEKFLYFTFKVHRLHLQKKKKKKKNELFQQCAHLQFIKKLGMENFSPFRTLSAFPSGVAVAAVLTNTALAAWVPLAARLLAN